MGGGQIPKYLAKVYEKKYWQPLFACCGYNILKILVFFMFRP